MALLIFYRHPPTSLKYALHHLSSGGIFLYFTSLSYIIFLLGCATSQLRNLNHIISLLSSTVSHHVSKSWTMSPSSDIWSWCCIISPPRACPCNVKVLAAFFLKLQGFIGISEIIIRSPCIFYLWNLDVWLQCYTPLMFEWCCLWKLLYMNVGTASANKVLT